MARWSIRQLMLAIAIVAVSLKGHTPATKMSGGSNMHRFSIQTMMIAIDGIAVVLALGKKGIATPPGYGRVKVRTAPNPFAENQFRSASTA
jgi:hypothetical protein